MNRRGFFALCALGVLLLPACAGGNGNGEIRIAADEHEIALVTAGQTAFALDLYGRLGAGPGNVFFSPLSVSLALSMTAAGARGETLQEMAATLHLSEGPSAHAACGALQDSLARTSDGARLSIANRIWPDRRVMLREEFARQTAAYYGADARSLDFADDPEGSRTTINEWIAGRTEQMIPELLQPGDVSASTILALTNAVYFRGLWDRPFPPEQTRSGSFHVAPGRTADVPYMIQEGEFLLAATPDAEILQMNYAGDEMAFVIALPREKDGLADLEASLSPETLAAWFESLAPRNTSIFVPRFELDERADLKRVLMNLGMTKAFGPEADFTGMFEDRGAWIDAVIHQARLILDEEGTEAAAATAVLMKRTSASRPFRADHPFLFLIRDLRTGSVVFLGRFVEP